MLTSWEWIAPDSALQSQRTVPASTIDGASDGRKATDASCSCVYEMKIDGEWSG